MSDYIYGSSLRAAKSKANYLFEGDFRRRPNQNLSGASRSVARVDLIQQAAEERQNREDCRRRLNAALKIQSVYRGYNSRKQNAFKMRQRFDATIAEYGNNPSETSFIYIINGHLISEFIIFFHIDKDRQRFDTLIDLMIANSQTIVKSKQLEPKVWLNRLTKLLAINLRLIMGHHGLDLDSRNIKFLYHFTKLDTILDKSEAHIIWPALVVRGFYSIMRHLVDAHKNTHHDSQMCCCLLELLARSLDLDTCDSVEDRTSTAYAFFDQFLRGPISPTIEKHYLPELLRLGPSQLEPKCIVKSFSRSNDEIKQRLGFVTNKSSMFVGHNNQDKPTKDIQECEKTIWLCYSFVRALYTRIDQLNDIHKVSYINIISILLGPGQYITNKSLIRAAANQDDNEDGDQDSPDELNTLASTRTQNQFTQYYSETHHVITKIIELINQLQHINGLKSIVFNSELQPQVQSAIVSICNLMLAHEYLAIFNCRLLYTVAFSKEFSRSLWNSVVSATSSTLYGTGVPLYVQISRGNNISPASWRTFLPKLRLFCSLCSYLLPTLDDSEFYTNNNDDDDDRMFVDTSDTSGSSSRDKSPALAHRESGPASGGFYVDRELVGISATLRDLCIGLIEILYQANRNSHHPINQSNSSRFNAIGQDEQNRLLSFEIKSCFQALVRLVCQLHARDSRKQFCPDGHWQSASVIIPANRAVDFQLVSSQQGRLLNQMTQGMSGSSGGGGQSNIEGATTSNDQFYSTPGVVLTSEIKTVLILQEIPFVISFHDRVQIFHQLLRKEHQIHQSDGYHFGLPGTAIKVQIRRNYIYEDAFEKLSYENEPNMKLPLKISLINSVGTDEAGIDGGGLSKEFLGELLKAGFDPMRGFFKNTRDHLLYPNPSANVLFANFPEGFETHYEFLGRMLGKAIFEKIMVELPLASFFLAKLLAVKNSSDVDLHNLQSLDPVLYKNLVYLKNYKADVADLNLDFTISNNELGEHEVVELKPGGSKIPVTRENKIEYVHLVADYRLNKQIRLQCAAFKRGLAQLVDLDWLRMFDPRELQILISGAPTVIDVADWRRHTRYGNGYTDTCEAIQTFWNVVADFDEDQKRKLLKFATSCSLPPLLGFKDLVPQFAIAPAEEERLPTASTCINLLKLPECEDEKTMRSKLLYAIESNSGFELS